MTRPGDVFGDFVIVREAGRGAMGVVYEAKQSSLDRRVALKVLAPDAANDVLLVERFLHTAALVARLSHPGILPVYAVGRDGGTPWFAMELVDGEDLDVVL